MPDWVETHKESIRFVTMTILGIILIFVGSGAVVGDSEPALVAMGAGALGINGYYSASDAGSPK